MTKGRNRATKRRRIRRVTKRVDLDLGTHIASRRAVAKGYGRGISRKDFATNEAH